MIQPKSPDPLGAVRRAHTTSGMPDVIDFGEVIIIARMIGRILQQIPRSEITKTIKLMRISAYEFRDEGFATPASVIVETLASSWENFTGSTEQAEMDLITALIPAVKIPLKPIWD